MPHRSAHRHIQSKEVGKPKGIRSNTSIHFACEWHEGGQWQDLWSWTKQRRRKKCRTETTWLQRKSERKNNHHAKWNYHVQVDTWLSFDRIVLRLNTKAAAAHFFLFLLLPSYYVFIVPPPSSRPGKLFKLFLLHISLFHSLSLNSIGAIALCNSEMSTWASENARATKQKIENWKEKRRKDEEEENWERNNWKNPSKMKRNVFAEWAC